MVCLSFLYVIRISDLEDYIIIGEAEGASCILFLQMSARTARSSLTVPLIHNNWNSHFFFWFGFVITKFIHIMK